MSYSLAPHLTALLADQTAAPVEDVKPAHAYVLVDVAQIKGMDRRWKGLAGNSPLALLFENTLAHNALALSPVLVMVSDDPAQALAQCLAWDKACQSRPALSLLSSPADLSTVCQHLKSLLMIEADGTDYLWRFADTQMLQATASVLTIEQRQQVLGPCTAWRFADHAGELKQLLSDDPLGADAAPKLVLDDIQTDAMLQACAGPMLASQLRAMEPSFDADLTHAEQNAFVLDCVQLAEDEGIALDEELLSWSTERWQAQNASAA